jgi:hydroxypyruvate reductase
MALAVEQAWPPGAHLEGIAITRYGHGLPTGRVRVVEAGHPIPDEAGLAAAREILAAARGLGGDDLLLALLSGGGSALLGVPVDAIPLTDLKRATAGLLRCGARIEEINVVRKHLATTLGGRLTTATAAPVVALVISDVTGDDPTHIASGPCAPDPSTYAEALEVFTRYGETPPLSVAAHLSAGAAGRVEETPKPGAPAFARVTHRVIADARMALEAGASALRAGGLEPVLLGDTITGEARIVARGMAARVRELRRTGSSAGPVVLVSGGETTVTVRGAGGRGGRGGEFLLALALALDGEAGVHALAADTDGIDGTEDNAGGLIAPDSLTRARARGIDPARLLDENDSYSFFAALGDLVVTGPTRTNVNEYRAIVCT